MRVGIDLDNTIICYDALFGQLAAERKLIPAGIRPHKQAIRDYLRSVGQEDRWTELQGVAYGSRIEQAVAFEGVVEFFRHCAEHQIEWWIISHRTRFPYLGDPVDLHAAARQWLVNREFLSENRLDHLRLEISRDAKLRAITESACHVFVDDLPELLTDPQFPKPVRRILFDPANLGTDRPEYERVSSWFGILQLLGVPHC